MRMRPILLPGPAQGTAGHATWVRLGVAHVASGPGSAGIPARLVRLLPGFPWPPPEQATRCACPRSREGHPGDPGGLHMVRRCARLGAVEAAEYAGGSVASCG